MSYPFASETVCNAAIRDVGAGRAIDGYLGGELPLNALSWQGVASACCRIQDVGILAVQTAGSRWLNIGGFTVKQTIILIIFCSLWVLVDTVFAVLGALNLLHTDLVEWVVRVAGLACQTDKVLGIQTSNASVDEGNEIFEACDLVVGEYGLEGFAHESSEIGPSEVEGAGRVGVETRVSEEVAHRTHVPLDSVKVASVEGCFKLS